MNKTSIIQHIIGALTRELESYARSADSAHAEAIDVQNKAENKYDTRALEASYLANGQAQQATEVRRAIQQFEALVPRAFGPAEAIDLGALVELERKGERTVYFLGPRAGGTEIVVDGQPVLVITPHSPLGRQLMGCKQGDRVQIKVGATSDATRVVTVA